MSGMVWQQRLPFAACLPQCS